MRLWFGSGTEAGDHSPIQGFVFCGWEVRDVTQPNGTDQDKHDHFKVRTERQLETETSRKKLYITDFLFFFFFPGDDGDLRPY